MVFCGRADCRDVVVDGMLWRTAGKSALYAGELVVTELVMTSRQGGSSYVLSGQLPDRSLARFLCGSPK